ncbi:hypothetical protein SLE2022_119840 [Rubroshorea leprosula]
MFAKGNSGGGDSIGGRKKKHEVRKQMRFIGIDGKNKAVGKTEQGIPKKSPDSNAGEGKRRPRNATSWQPDLTSITELHGSDK